MASAADWPQLFGPYRDGVTVETGLLKEWPKEGPKLLWSKTVGSGWSGVVVAGDRAVLFHRVGDEEIIECLNAADGKPVWKFPYATGYVDDFRFDDGPRATPILHGNHVYTLGAEGTLTCVTLDEGTKVWQRNINTDFKVAKGFFGAASTPIVVGKLLLVNVGGRDEKAGIVAFDRETGKEVWRATDHEVSYSSPVATMIQGAWHVFFFTRTGLVSLDPANGNVRFSFRWRPRINASVNAASPVVVGDLVFVSTSYDTGAIVIKADAKSYDEVWKNDESLSCHYNTPVHKDGHLYGIDGRQEGRARLRCVELKTGKVKWTQERFGCATLISCDGHFLAMNENGELVLFEARSDAYREKARGKILGEPVRAAPALSHGRLYARDGKKLVCVQVGQ
jgi:outer membrane protein assembly factor BamB